MPSEKGNMTSLGVWLNGDLIRRLNDLAKKGDITRSKLVGYLIHEGVNFIEPYEKMGLWKFTAALCTVRDMAFRREEKKIEDVASKTMTIWVNKDLDAALDRIARKGNLTKSRLVMNLIDSAMEEREIWNGIGEIAPAKVFKEWREKLEKHLTRMTEKEGIQINQDVTLSPRGICASGLPSARGH